MARDHDMSAVTRAFTVTPRRHVDVFKVFKVCVIIPFKQRWGVNFIQ